MAGDCKLLEAEMPHQCNAVARLGALRRAAVVGGIKRFGRLAKPTQVRANHGMRPGQKRRHLVPGGVRARVAMQQQKGWPASAMPDSESSVLKINVVEFELLKHRL